MTSYPNYSTMSDDELDQLSIDKFGWEIRIYLNNKWHEVYDSDNKLVWSGICYNQASTQIKPHQYWSPTHSDSNQAERYLFPKIFDKDITKRSTNIMITCETFKTDFIVRVQKFVGFSLPLKNLANIRCDNPDQINRTKTIACFQAFDKLNEVDGE